MSTATAIVSPHDQRVTFVELFFDLVFVFSVTQVVVLLHGHVDLASAGSALLVFWLVWWAWTQFTWALNAANTDHPRIQAVTLAATAVAFFMAIGIPRAVGDGALWFAIPYVAARAIGLVVYNWVARSDAALRRAVRVFSAVSLTGLAAVLAGAALGGAAQYWSWTLAIALDLVAASVGGRQTGWNLHPAHFAERHGLIVIIALGETLIIAAAGLTGAPRTPAAISSGVLTVAVTCGLWWSYFRHAPHAFEHALEAKQDSDRASTARDTFSVLHFPMLCGIVAIAAAMEVALAHPDDALATDIRAALSAGLVLFVAGTGAALWRATGRVFGWRLAIAPAAAVGVLLVGTEPWSAMSILVAGLGAIAVVEHAH